MDGRGVGEGHEEAPRAGCFAPRFEHRGATNAGRVARACHELRRQRRGLRGHDAAGASRHEAAHRLPRHLCGSTCVLGAQRGGEGSEDVERLVHAARHPEKGRGRCARDGHKAPGSVAAFHHSGHPQRVLCRGRRYPDSVEEVAGKAVKGEKAAFREVGNSRRDGLPRAEASARAVPGRRLRAVRLPGLRCTPVLEEVRVGGFGLPEGVPRLAPAQASRRPARSRLPHSGALARLCAQEGLGEEARGCRPHPTVLPHPPPKEAGPAAERSCFQDRRMLARTP
mmetsp:Transcript_106153/g.317095  ORF Transcript_106153/g.317095 Transcript_106153/m.317095 type:complete len:282 (+) Transcript_106153:1939-2784(+)